MVNAIKRTDLTFEICSIFPGNPYMEKKINCKTRVLFHNNRIMNLRTVKLIPGIVWTNILKVRDYDQVVLYGSEAILLCGFCMPKEKTICWIHDNPEFADGRNFSRYRSARSKLTFLRKQKAYKRAKKIVCVSGQCQQNFSEIWGFSDKLVTLHNILNIDEIRKKSIEFAPEFDNKVVNMVTVGRLSYEKAYDRIVFAVKKVIQTGIDVCIYIIGDGEKKQPLRNLIEQEKVEKYIKLLGAKENPYPYIKNADALLICSISEAYSTVAVEAKILGIPVLSTDCCGMRDILSNEDSSVICANSQEAFSEALISFAETNSLSARKKKAKQRSEAVSMDEVREKIEEFFLANVSE